MANQKTLMLKWFSRFSWFFQSMGELGPKLVHGLEKPGKPGKNT